MHHIYIQSQAGLKIFTYLEMDKKKLFEGIDLTEYTPKQIASATKLYNYIVESAETAKREGKDLGEVIDEGILGGLLGGTVGATAGASIMKGVCRALGVDENGALGRLLTSRIIIGALGSYIGYN